MLIFGLFVDGKTIVNDVPDYRQVPAKTALSEKLAKDLKKRGFKFTGPVAVYPSYKQQAWLMTMRMIVNGKTVISEYR